MTTSASLLLPVTTAPVHPGLPRRKSAEEKGEREPGGLGTGLAAPAKTTSRAERRRSINPMGYPVDVEAAVNGPRSPDRSNHDSQVTSHSDAWLGPLPPSPLRSSFTTGSKAAGARDGRSSPAPSLDRPGGMRRTSSRDNVSLNSSTSTARGSLGPSPRIHSDDGRQTPAPSVYFDAQDDNSGRSSLPRSPSAGTPAISIRPSSQSSFAGGVAPSPTRSSSLTSTATPFPSSPSRDSFSSERDTTPTIAVSTSPPPRQRSISSISTQAPRLDAHRPVSFLLSDDPDFSKLFDASAPRGTFDGVNIGLDPLGQPLDVSQGQPLPVQRLREGSEDSTLPEVPPSPDFSDDQPSLRIDSAGLRVRRDSENSVFTGQSEVNELVRQLAELSAGAKEDGQETISIKIEQLDEILSAVVQGQDRFMTLKEKYDGVKVRRHPLSASSRCCRH